MSLWLHGHPIGCLGLRFGSVALEIPPSNCCRSGSRAS
ncbi:Alanine--tRNA ligase [Zea mays]|uniref:Alanine--tRNA ligase n=1 Tax=Zea mays TaxID=4577 RepID=A0A1D6KHJ7_MAIZE|nr:Alanine--tRNA ligase [Zea mays]